MRARPKGTARGVGLRKRSSERAVPQIMIAPLVDIVFLLLIFFMLVTRFLSPSIAVALPESDSGAIDESRCRTVSIDVDGLTYLDDVRLSLEEITETLAGDRAAGEFDIVRLRADRDTPFQMIIDAMDAIRRSGTTDIAIETSPDDEDSSPDAGED